MVPSIRYDDCPIRHVDSDKSIKSDKSDKSVSFADQENLQYYDDANFHQPQKTDIWYTSGDFHHFRRRDYRLMKCLSTRKMNPHTIEDEYNDSVRGLLDNKGKDSRFNRQSCCAVVLAGSSALQDLRTSAPDLMALVEEEKVGGKDEEILAHVYGLACTSSVQKAIDRAEKDSKFVDEYIRYASPDDNIDDVHCYGYETSRRKVQSSYRTVAKKTGGPSFMGIQFSSIMCSSFLAMAA